MHRAGNGKGSRFSRQCLANPIPYGDQRGWPFTRIGGELLGIHRSSEEARNPSNAASTAAVRRYRSTCSRPHPAVTRGGESAASAYRHHRAGPLRCGGRASSDQQGQAPRTDGSGGGVRRRTCLLPTDGQSARRSTQGPARRVHTGDRITTRNVTREWPNDTEPVRKPYLSAFFSRILLSPATVPCLACGGETWSAQSGGHHDCRAAV